jgi:hypothetical protein
LRVKFGPKGDKVTGGIPYIHYKILVRKPTGKHDCQDLAVDGIVILECMMKK